jgi:hypothetical protein
LVFTVFDEIDRLWRTVLSLIDKGVEADQLCIVGTTRSRSALESRLRTPDADGDEPHRHALHLQAVLPTIWLDHHRSVVATAGSVLRLLGGPDRGTGSLEGLPDAVGRLREAIAALASQGVTVLVVSSVDPGQQLSATRTLLDHSSHWVTTHEFAAMHRRHEQLAPA